MNARQNRRSFTPFSHGNGAVRAAPKRVTCCYGSVGKHKDDKDSRNKNNKIIKS